MFPPFRFEELHGDLPSLEPARLPVGTLVLSGAEKSGARAELIAANGPELASDALFAVSLAEKCQRCGKLGVWSCSGCSSVLYCSVECQQLLWPSHRATCLPANVIVPKFESVAALPCEASLDLQTVIEQLNFAVRIVDRCNVDEVPCAEVWKAVAVLEHILPVLRPFMDKPVQMEEVEKEVYFFNGSLGYLTVKVLVTASQATGYVGEDKRAVAYADDAISLLADLRKPYVSNRFGMEDHVVLQAKAHFARALSLPPSADKGQALDTATQLCKHYGLGAESIWMPASHQQCLLWDWCKKIRTDSSSDQATSDGGDGSDAENATECDPPPAPPPPPLLPECSACAKCGDMVRKKRMRIHWQKQCAGRRITCPYCSEWCEAAFMDEHQANDCQEFPTSCELCGVLVARSLMAWHSQSDCCFRMVSCQNGCGWEGVADSAALHQEGCPFSQQTCAFCMESFQARFMPSHVCPLVLMDQICAACCDPFGDLVKQGVLPAIFLRNLVALIRIRSGRRSCSHVSLCMRCATKWFHKAEDRSVLAQCPLCREEFDGLTECPPDLLVEVRQSSSTETRTRPFPRLAMAGGAAAATTGRGLMKLLAGGREACLVDFGGSSAAMDIYVLCHEVRGMDLSPGEQVSVSLRDLTRSDPEKETMPGRPWELRQVRSEAVLQLRAWASSSSPDSRRHFGGAEASYSAA
eukprot:s4063_g2.t1